MCVIVVKKAGVELPSKEILKQCWESNPDGAGYAVRVMSNGNIYFKKGFDDFKQFYDEIKVHVLKQEDAILHFRIATRGVVSRQLCHPFVIDRDNVNPLNGWAEGVMFHNGTFPTVPVEGEKESDSLVVARTLSQLGFRSYQTRAVEGLIDSALGTHSRLAVLTNNSGINLFGAGWEEEEGIYYSNTRWAWAYSYDDFRAGKYCPSCYHFTTDSMVHQCPVCGERMV